MLELEYRMRNRPTWDDPEEGVHTIRTDDLELDINEIMKENELTLEEAKEEILKDFIPCKGDINEMGWCDIEIEGETLSLDEVWNMDLYFLSGLTITFEETEN